MPYGIDDVAKASARRKDVVDDEDAFTICDLETTLECASAVVALGEDALRAEHTRDFVADDDAARGGTGDEMSVEFARPVGDHTAERFGLRRAFEKTELLDVEERVLAGCELEVAFEKSAGIAK